MSQKVKRQKHKRADELLDESLTLSKGTPFRKIVGSKIIDEREYSLHATKGYRSHKE